MRIIGGILILMGIVILEAGWIGAIVYGFLRLFGVVDDDPKGAVMGTYALLLLWLFIHGAILALD